jgi:adenosylcobinamide-GDP ribazoletransferase
MFFKYLQSLFLELRFAISFLTLLPVSPKAKLDEKIISDSLAFFPFAALFFSLLSAGFIYLNTFIDNQLVLAFLIISSHALLSGGLHLDAVMDSHDGLACSDRARDEIVRVMKDSRAGAFAVIALFFTLSAQLIFISQADYSSSLYLYLLILVPVLSRIFMVLELVFFVNPKKLDAKSSLLTFVQVSKFKALILGSLVILALVYFYPHTKICILVFVFIALVFSILFYRFLNYKLKGQNGDSIGCGLVVNEVFMYLLIFVFSNLS